MIVLFKHKSLLIKDILLYPYIKMLIQKEQGHIAVIVPSSKDIEKIKNEGPDTAQAGNINFSCSSLKKGFRNKKDAFKNNEIKFYYYKI